MTETLKRVLKDEIQFITEDIAYECLDDLRPLQTLAAATEQVNDCIDDFGDDLPEALRDPVIMMLVWNYCLDRAMKRRNTQ